MNVFIWHGKLDRDKCMASWREWKEALNRGDRGTWTTQGFVALLDAVDEELEKLQEVIRELEESNQELKEETDEPKGDERFFTPKRLFF